MPRKYLEKRELEGDEEDPLSPTYRTFFFREDAADTRERSEKVKEQFVEAGKDTRNANQLVKFVNAHLQGKVAQVERLKEAQKKFDEELDMFSASSAVGEGAQSRQQPINPDVEKAMVLRELSAMISKYGIEKMSDALDQIIAGQK